MFTGEYDADSTTFAFTGGGNQGARGEESGGDWFVENVLAELDEADEYVQESEKVETSRDARSEPLIPRSPFIYSKLAKSGSKRVKSAPKRATSVVKALPATQPRYELRILARLARKPRSQQRALALVSRNSLFWSDPLVRGLAPLPSTLAHARFALRYFFDGDNQLLYVMVNATAGVTNPEQLGMLVVPQLEAAFNIMGESPDNAAESITLEHFKISNTKPTYLTAEHTVPSGGDWSLERRGAVFVENTRNTVLSDVVIDKVDGHGVMISGMNRNTTVKDCSISFTGGSGIASWGRTDGELGLDGFTALKGWYPDGNNILRNVIREVGHFEKQNSFYVQAKTARSVIKDNVMFNGPRAGINFNDGFTGGDVMEGNLVFNTCRESSDHGPFNR